MFRNGDRSPLLTSDIHLYSAKRMFAGRLRMVRKDAGSLRVTVEPSGGKGRCRGTAACRRPACRRPEDLAWAR